MIIRETYNKVPAPAPTGETARGLRKHTWAALGTQCEVQFAMESDAQALAFSNAAMAWVADFEAKYSRFKPDSLVSRINAAAGKAWVEVDAEMEQLLNLCDSLNFMTQGVLDPTALPLLKLWNYKVEHPVVPGPDQIMAALRLVGWKKVQRTPGRIFLPESGMGLDFGGFGKEYAVDAVAQIALNFDIADALVDFGHDLRALGAPKGLPCWHIGLEDPKKPGALWGSVGVRDRGIASSGDYIRGFTVDGRRYGHIIDPRTGWPVAHGCHQATVIAGSCLEAGVISTTAFILGISAGLNFIQSFPGVEGCFVTDRERAQTRGFYAYLVS